MSDEKIEEMIQEKGLNAPRVTPQGIQDKIKAREFVVFHTHSGSVLRWCVLTMENGFTITGKPSASVSPENDDHEVGEQVAYENALREVWALEGYLLKQQLWEGDITYAGSSDLVLL